MATPEELNNLIAKLVKWSNGKALLSGDDLKETIEQIGIQWEAFQECDIADFVASKDNVLATLKNIRSLYLNQSRKLKAGQIVYWERF